MFDPGNLVNGVINLYIHVAKTRKESKREREYEQMITESQAKLVETTLVPGYTKIYA